MVSSLKICGLLLVLALCGLGLGSCEPDLPPLRTYEIEGDPNVVSRFAGSWYDYNGILILQVVRHPSPELMMRLPEGYGLEEVGAHGQEIFFRVHSSRGMDELSLQLEGEDVLVALRPGEEPSWCGTCTPRYERLNLPQRMKLRIAMNTQYALERTEESIEDAVNWLVYNL